MIRNLKQWMMMLPLAAGLFLMWPRAGTCALDNTGTNSNQKLEESMQKAKHMEDSNAFLSTIVVTVVVILLGVLFSIYFIRKDKSEDKDLEE